MKKLILAFVFALSANFAQGQTVTVAPFGSTTVAGKTCTLGSTCSPNMPMGGECNTISAVAATKKYCPVLAASAAQLVANEVLVQLPIGHAGTMSSFYVLIAVTPGAGNTQTITVRKNGVNTTLTCQITNGNTTCNDTTHSFTYVAGDKISVEQDPEGSGTINGTALTYGWNDAPSN